ncbi:uncharacterized protein PHALS_04987 [Plasmopara halstedii]|uniref:Uncharacterized protein n=1 Tax=Plasmopara halstedii TaxID=4781 RepID=A0A0P1A9I6_PLAHL|nr:uncharacterized protein PHALS_04987 [Plasmopara halstedii]CEG37393.1 hypothetical protein PHALS_04987 [Plasmopara halstedii]|eukprot:XP_024573762.1 hypothetical protein PHALS_04987 [Plasmopara halstedii]
MWAKLLYMLGSSENEQADSPHNNGTALKDTSLGNLIAFAKFSSIIPSESLLNGFQNEITNEVKFAVQLHELSKSNVGLNGLLCALFQSWIGKPFDGGVDSVEFASLKKALDLLKDDGCWRELEKLYGKDKAFSLVLDILFEMSNDEFMWYRFLRNLQYDTSFSIPLIELVEFLRTTWRHKLSSTKI